MPKLQPWCDKNKLFDIIGYKPFKEQWEFHNSDASIKILRCGSRFGKSKCSSAEEMPLICTPGSRGWIVAPSYTLGEKEWRYITDAIFAGPSFPNSQLKKLIGNGGKPLKISDNPTQGQMYLKLLWNYSPIPIEIQVRSWDKPQLSLLGEELDWILVSEGASLPREIWDRYLRMRLVSRSGTLIIPSTSTDNSDVMDEFFERGQNRHDKKVASWQFPAFCNPYWADDIEAEKAQLKKDLSQEAYEEQVLGYKVHYTGRFYKKFDSEVHVADLEFNNILTVYRSWDFGYRHPCIGWYQVNKRQQICWLYTYLGSDMDDIDLGLIGKYLSGELIYKKLPLNIKNKIDEEDLYPFIPPGDINEFQDFCDASGVQKKSSEMSAIRTLNSLGIHPFYVFEKKQKEEREPESIQIVRSTLKLRPRGESNLLIDRDNRLAINMFRNLAYEKKMDGSQSHKFKRDGYYEHVADQYKYFCLHTQKHLIYNRTSHKEIAYA